MNQPDEAILIYVEGNFIKGESGSHLRFDQTVQWACARFKRIYVYSYANHATAPWDDASRRRFAQKYPAATLILDQTGLALELLQKLKNALLETVPQFAARILQIRLPNLTPEFDELVAKQGKLSALIHFADSLTKLNGLTFQRIFVDTHDVKYVKLSRLHLKPTYSLTILRKMRGELARLAIVDGIIAISQAEHQLLSLLLPSVEAFYIPSFIGVSARPALMSPRTGPTYDLLFVGSDYSFNISGLAQFLRTHWGQLNKYTLAVAGKVGLAPEIQAICAMHHNVTILGFVDDLSALYGRVAAVISPVDGTGLKMKIYEALSHGLPVFASKSSMEGLPPGYRDCVFLCTAERIQSVLNRGELLVSAGIESQRYFDNCFTSSDLEKLNATLSICR